MSRASEPLIKAREFFRENPEEELTFEDMSIKFGIPYSKTYRLAQSLRDEGLCETVCIVRVAKLE